MTCAHDRLEKIIAMHYIPKPHQQRKKEIERYGEREKLVVCWLALKLMYLGSCPPAPPLML